MIAPVSGYPETGGITAHTLYRYGFNNLAGFPNTPDVGLPDPEVPATGFAARERPAAERRRPVPLLLGVGAAIAAVAMKGLALRVVPVRRRGGNPYRQGRIDGSTFGVYGTDNWGPAEIRGNAMKDLAALNKLEMLSWDEWGRMMASYEDGSAPSTTN